MAESDFMSFEEAISGARESGRLSERVALVIAGRVEFAVQRGDITPAQGGQLLEELEPGFKQRYADELDLAATGELDTDEVTRPITGVYG